MKAQSRKCNLKYILDPVIIYSFLDHQKIRNSNKNKSRKYQWKKELQNEELKNTNEENKDNKWIQPSPIKSESGNNAPLNTSLPSIRNQKDISKENEEIKMRKASPQSPKLKGKEGKQRDSKSLIFYKSKSQNRKATIRDTLNNGQPFSIEKSK